MPCPRGAVEDTEESHQAPLPSLGAAPQHCHAASCTAGWVLLHPHLHRPCAPRRQPAQGSAASRAAALPWFVGLRCDPCSRAASSCLASCNSRGSCWAKWHRNGAGAAPVRHVPKHLPISSTFGVSSSKGCLHGEHDGGERGAHGAVHGSGAGSWVEMQMDDGF